MKYSAEENQRRLHLDNTAGAFDPLRGTGSSGERREVVTPVAGLPRAYVPVEMLDDPDYTLINNNAEAWERLRCRHDFEYWCARCVTIKHKLTGADVPFVLNRPQRRLAAVMEADRRAGRPIRVIMLKARQWGGSTMVQMYMAWIQSCHRRNWNSLICAHVKDTAASIRGMYSKMLQSYPEPLWEGDAPPQFKPFERAQNIREISGRGCRVTLGSSENQEAVRGSDYAMAHLSETAFYASTTLRSPEKFIRAICGAIAYYPYTLIVMESTANGVGNYFHSEWLRCVEGKGDKHPVFVPWYEIDIYRLTPNDPQAVFDSMNDYERYLWTDLGLSLDRIYWYRCKSSEYPMREQMQAEYPTTPDEAFINTGNNVFESAAVERLRADCRPPVAVGDVSLLTGRFVEAANGKFRIWHRPEPGARYVVSVDVGGRSAKADWSVITVMRHRRSAGHDNPQRHCVAAQWRGHTDHDILADISIAISRMYNNALLIIESNTLESEYGPGDDNLFVLQRMKSRYNNLYQRPVAFDRQGQGTSTRVGFHTNRSTKAMLINGLIEAVRNADYIEHDYDALNELLTYQQLPNGSYSAQPGYHDDILMTRAIALWALNQASVPGIAPGTLRRLENHPVW